MVSVVTALVFLIVFDVIPFVTASSPIVSVTTGACLVPIDDTRGIRSSPFPSLASVPASRVLVAIANIGDAAATDLRLDVTNEQGQYQMALGSLPTATTMRVAVDIAVQSDSLVTSNLQAHWTGGSTNATSSSSVHTIACAHYSSSDGAFERALTQTSPVQYDDDMRPYNYNENAIDAADIGILSFAFIGVCVLAPFISLLIGVVYDKQHRK